MSGIIQKPQPVGSKAETPDQKIDEIVSNIDRNFLLLYQTLQQIQKALDAKQDA